MKDIFFVLASFSVFKMQLLNPWLLPILTAVVAGSDVNTAGGFHEHAIKLMEESPLIDTHIDLPQIIRSLSM